jgi:hypothetical protein
VPTYWPSRVCGGKGGAEVRWSMGAWRVAAEGSWSSTATRTVSCLSTDACRCCAGTYSPAGAAACVTCGAGPGERDACCSRVMLFIIIICMYVCIDIDIDVDEDFTSV